MSDQASRKKIAEAAIFTDVPGGLVARDTFDEPVNVTDGESVKMTVSFSGVTSNKPFDVIERLVNEDYHFQVLYDGQEFSIVASLPEWHELLSWKNGYAIVPVGKGATPEAAYQDLQEFLKDFTPGQITMPERESE